MRLSENRIRVIPYGVDLAFFTPQPQPRRPFTVLFVGIVSDSKSRAGMMKPRLEWAFSNRADLELMRGPAGATAAQYRWTRFRSQLAATLRSIKIDYCLER